MPLWCVFSCLCFKQMLIEPIKWARLCLEPGNLERIIPEVLVLRWLHSGEKDKSLVSKQSFQFEYCRENITGHCETHKGRERSDCSKKDSVEKMRFVLWFKQQEEPSRPLLGEEKSMSPPVEASWSRGKAGGHCTAPEAGRTVHGQAAKAAQVTASNVCLWKSHICPTAWPAEELKIELQGDTFLL